MKSLPYIFLLVTTGSLWLLPTPLIWGQTIAISTPLPPISTIAQANKNKEIVKKIDDIAEQITIRINTKYGGNASGVIIAKQGQDYYVLTAGHVVDKDNSSSRSGCDFVNREGKEEYTIVTPDKEQYQVKPENITCFQDVDLAVIKFHSPKRYTVATLGNYNLSLEEKSNNYYAFISGFSEKLTEKNQQILTAGTLLNRYEQRSDAVDPYLFTNGTDLLYTTPIYVGMGGGAVLDNQGNLIGIHIGSDSEVATNPDGKLIEVSKRFSLGIPIKTFLGLVTKTEINPNSLKLSSSSTSPLNSQQITEIYQQLQAPTLKMPSPEAKAYDWINYGSLLWRYGKITEAKEAFSKAIELNPSDGLGYYLRASVEPNDQLALADLDQCLETVPPSDYKCYLKRARIYSDMGKFNQAIADYSYVIRLENNIPIVYFELGEIYEKIGNQKEALANFQEAAKFYPPDTEIYQRLQNKIQQLQNH